MSASESISKGLRRGLQRSAEEERVSNAIRKGLQRSAEEARKKRKVRIGVACCIADECAVCPYADVGENEICTYNLLTDLDRVLGTKFPGDL